jgi:hypothetical protein
LVWFLLLVLVPGGVILYLVWDHRRRAADRASASATRLHAILTAPAERPLVPSAEGEASVQPPPPEPKTAAPLILSYEARERLLTPPQALLYYLLKTGLPDHLVFAQVALAAVLEPSHALSGFALDEQTRRLAAHALDFVVCDRNMRPVAVVELAHRDSQQETGPSRKSWLLASGLRYVELASDALPRKEAMRALILAEQAEQGSPGSGAGSQA